MAVSFVVLLLFALHFGPLEGQFDMDFDFPPPWHRHWDGGGPWGPHRGRRFCWRHPDHPRCWGMPPPGPWMPPPEPAWQPPPQPPTPAPRPPPATRPPPPPRPPPTTRAPAPVPPPRVFMPPQGSVPHGPPGALLRMARDIKFGQLDAAPRQSLISSCTSRRVSCRTASPQDAQKRSNILAFELQTQRKLAPATTSTAIDGRLMRVHQVKRELVSRAGLGQQVVPPNDGTFAQDVLLTDLQTTQLLNSLRSRSKRSGIYREGFPSQLWDVGKPIAYTFDVSLLPSNQQVVRNALGEIESKTCIRFQYFSRKPSQNHIYFQRINSPTFCGLSYIGKVSPANPVYLSFACPEFTGIIVHEILHALGIMHQHLRTDRDENVRIDWANVNPQLYDHFAIADAKMFTTYGVPYDYHSIMHYSAYVGAIDSRKPTITPLTQTQRFLQVLGQRRKLSDRDIELLNALYCSTATCVDRNVFCGFWALKRLCNSRDNGGWLQQNCRKSCGFCR